MIVIGKGAIDIIDVSKTAKRIVEAENNPLSQEEKLCVLRDWAFQQVVNTRARARPVFMPQKRPYMKVVSYLPLFPLP